MHYSELVVLGSSKTLLDVIDSSRVYRCWAENCTEGRSLSRRP
jgi:hypothetical protein